MITGLVSYFDDQQIPSLSLLPYSQALSIHLFSVLNLNELSVKVDGIKLKRN